MKKTHLSYPEMIEIELTNQCNLNCIHCNIRNTFYKNEELSVEEWRKIIKDIFKDGALRIAFTGGEPLLYKHVIQVLEYSIEIGFEPALLTNGILLDSNKVYKLEKVGLKQIQISFDGATYEIFSQIRGISKRIFEKIIYNIQNVGNSSIELFLNTVINTINYKEIPQMIEKAISMKAKAIRFVNLVPVTKRLKEIQLNNQELKKVIMELQRLKEKYKKQITVVLPTFKLWGPKRKTLLSFLGNENSLLCEAGTVLCTITPTGDVIPCSYFRTSQFIAGNVTRLSLKEIWNNSPVLKRFRELGQLPSSCKSCSIKVYCRGGCRAMAYFNEGDLKAVDPRCDIFKMQIV